MPGISALTEFKTFLLRGNAIDLAIGIVMGAAFGAVVKGIVSDFLTPLVGAIFGTHNFAKLTFGIHNSTFLYGHFINTVVTFVLVAIAVFFFVIKPMNAFVRRFGAGQEPEADPPPDVQLLTEIRDLLREGA
jgi:large conductance mechanosensitive channel